MVLHAFFERYPHNYRGFYIDVGAHDPFRFSNTQYFYEKNWSGINIEPTPDLFARFKQHRKRDININTGIANEKGEMTFYCFDEPALNSFSRELSMDRHTNTSYTIVKEVPVPVSPLSEVLDKYLPAGQHINFMSVDVEGLDLDVLKSNNWTKYRPDYLLVEDILPFAEVNTSDVYHFLSGHRYHLVAKTIRTLVFQAGK